MKTSDMKVVAIILAIALFFTIVTSNVVSIASVVLLTKGGSAETVNSGDASNNAPVNNTTPVNNSNTNTNTNTNTATPSGNTNTSTPSSSTTPDNNSSNTTPADNSTPSANPVDMEAFNFYKAACEDIQKNGSAKFTRKEWQEIKAMDLGTGTSILEPIIKSFIKDESSAAEKVCEKGSDDAKNRIAPCGCDVNMVASAKRETLSNGNYKVTIVMKDENSPAKGSNGVAAMATGILYVEDVRDTVQNDGTVSKVVKSLDKAEIVYKAYTIEAEMTKDGHFVSISHSTTGELAADAKLFIGSISGTGTLAFTSRWYDFAY